MEMIGHDGADWKRTWETRHDQSLSSASRSHTTRHIGKVFNLVTGGKVQTLLYTNPTTPRITALIQNLRDLTYFLQHPPSETKMPKQRATPAVKKSTLGSIKQREATVPAKKSAKPITSAPVDEPCEDVRWTSHYKSENFDAFWLKANDLIQDLGHIGKSGNPAAIEAIYEIACMSIKALNQFSDETLSPLAQSKIQWPTFQTLSPHYNKDVTHRLQEKLNLGAARNLPIDLRKIDKSLDAIHRKVVKALYGYMVACSRSLQFEFQYRHYLSDARKNGTLPPEKDARVQRAKTEVDEALQALRLKFGDLSRELGIQHDLPANFVQQWPAKCYECLERSNDSKAIWKVAKEILKWLTDSKIETTYLLVSIKDELKKIEEGPAPRSRARYRIYKKLEQAFQSLLVQP